jgi:hydroxyacylglutathione hydrolase
LHGASLIGMDNIAGWAGPEFMEHAKQAGRPIITTEQLGPKDAKASGRMIVDVRGKSERDHDAIPGSRHAFLGDLIAQMKDVPKDQPLVMHCQGGSRSATAASLLQAHGFTNVANLKGGIDAWKEAGLAVEGS